MVLAPFTPFLAEELYQKLTGGESVHFLDWPERGTVNEAVLEQMARTREIIEKGLAARMAKSETEQQVKVRQPLSSLTYAGEKLSDELEQMIAEEVNVKQVITSGDEGYVTVDKTITPELAREGMMREVIRNVQSARKKADLNVDDHIRLALLTHVDELGEAINEHLSVIAAETLADDIVHESRDYAFVTDCKVEGHELVIGLEKA